MRSAATTVAAQNTLSMIAHSSKLWGKKKQLKGKEGMAKKGAQTPLATVSTSKNSQKEALEA